MSNAERQAKWMEKNRALHNFRRRKKPLSGGDKTGDVRWQAESKSKDPCNPYRGETQAPPAQLPEITVSAGKFPKTITLSSPITSAVEASAPPPLVYRDDYNRVITKGQWEKLQGMKEKAKENNYEIDQYSQL